MRLRMRLVSTTTALVVGALAPAVTAQTAEQQTQAEAEAKEHANDQIKGIKFGVGIAGTWGAERIEEAQIIDGKVRVTKGQRGTPAFWLETHLLIPVKVGDHRGTVKRRILNDTVEIPVDNYASFGVGPFLGIQSSSESALDAMAGGLMFGFRRPGASENSLNVGFGISVDPKFQVLGDGLVADSAPPGKETAIRYRTKSQPRFIVMFSFAF